MGNAHAGVILFLFLASMAFGAEQNFGECLLGKLGRTTQLRTLVGVILITLIVLFMLPGAIEAILGWLPKSPGVV